LKVVRTGTAGEAVLAGFTQETVVAGVSRHRVGSVEGADDVGSVAGHDRVSSGGASDDVGTCRSSQRARVDRAVVRAAHDATVLDVDRRGLTGADRCGRRVGCFGVVGRGRAAWVARVVDGPVSVVVQAVRARRSLGDRDLT
jgi:hypothetical protein